MTLTKQQAKTVGTLYFPEQRVRIYAQVARNDSDAITCAGHYSIRRSSDRHWFCASVCCTDGRTYHWQVDKFELARYVAFGRVQLSDGFKITMLDSAYENGVPIMMVEPV